MTPHYHEKAERRARPCCEEEVELDHEQNPHLKQAEALLLAQGRPKAAKGPKGARRVIGQWWHLPGLRSGRPRYYT